MSKKRTVYTATLKNEIGFRSFKRFHETLECKKPMSVYFESLKINMKKVEIQEEDVA